MMRGSDLHSDFPQDSAGAAAHSLRHSPRRQPMRMAVDGGPGPRGRMPPAAPDTTQPLETTRRTALATAARAPCGCGLYLATSEDETRLDAAQIKLNDAAKARDERFARVMSCVEILSSNERNEPRAIDATTIDATSTQVMSGGMRDYEGWEEVRAFKTELFSHVKKTTTSWKSASAARRTCSTTAVRRSACAPSSRTRPSSTWRRRKPSGRTRRSTSSRASPRRCPLKIIV